MREPAPQWRSCLPSTETRRIQKRHASMTHCWLVRRCVGLVFYLCSLFSFAFFVSNLASHLVPALHSVEGKQFTTLPRFLPLYLSSHPPTSRPACRPTCFLSGGGAHSLQPPPGVTSFWPVGDVAGARAREREREQGLGVRVRLCVALSNRTNLSKYLIQLYSHA